MFALARIFETAWQWPGWRSAAVFRAMCCLLFVVQLWRFASPFDPLAEVNESTEPIQIALHLHEGQGFAAPFSSHFTGATAHTAPVFPAFVALLVEVFGTGAAGAFALSNAAAVVLAAQTALLPVLGSALGMHPLVGLIAALITLTPGTLQKYSNWDANYLALLVMLVTLSICGMIQSREKPLYRTGLVAFLWGLLLLASPNALLAYCGWLVWLAFFLRNSHQPKRLRVAGLTFMVVIPALVLLPWTLRNYSVFGKWFFVRDNLGLELMVSNNPCAQFGSRVNARSGCFDTFHPQDNAVIARRLAEMGEPAFNLEMRRKAVEWMQQNPRQFLTLTLQRFWFFWFPSFTGDNFEDLLETRPIRSFVVYCATLLSIPGLFLFFTKNRAGGVLCLLWLGCFPLVHYVVQVEGRYRIPILWLTFLLAAFALTRVGLWATRRLVFLRDDAIAMQPTMLMPSRSAGRINGEVLGSLGFEPSRSESGAKKISR